MNLGDTGERKTHSTVENDSGKRQIILIGLDGFDPGLARSWMADGTLPVLQSLSRKGSFAALRSTIPPFTYPAWSSILTGVNPGRHGIIDFAIRMPGSYSVQYVNSTYRLEPTLFSRLSDTGCRVVAVGFPTTYPPEPINGIMISGFDSPLAFEADRSFCHPPAVWNELRSMGSAYTLAGIPELDTRRDWHRKAAATIRTTIETRTSIAEYLLHREHWDVFGIVFSESDTAAHHFWAAWDESSPRHHAFNGLFGSVLKDTYSRLDDSIGRILSLADPDAIVIVASDHGFGGAGNRLISLNRILSQHGFFRFRKKTQTNRHPEYCNQNNSRFCNGWIRRMAAQLPPQLGQWLFRKGPRKLLQHLENRNRLIHADLAHSIAFSDELNYFPSIWLNDQRFPEGRPIDASARETVLSEIRHALLAYRHPETGAPIIAAVHPKEKLYHGAALEWIPDLIVEPALDGDFSYSVWHTDCDGSPVMELPEKELKGRKGGSMNGSHRQQGIFCSNLPGLVSDRNPCVEDIGVTVLDAAGYDFRAWNPDGVSLLRTEPDRKLPHSELPTAPEVNRKQYPADESERLEDRLRKLGYL